MTAIFPFIILDFRVIKLSSPNLNYLIIAGAAILYACVFLFATSINSENNATSICNVSNNANGHHTHNVKLHVFISISGCTTGNLIRTFYAVLLGSHMGFFSRLYSVFWCDIS